jgi:hypothetical protein
MESRNTASESIQSGQHDRQQGDADRCKDLSTDPRSTYRPLSSPWRSGRGLTLSARHAAPRGAHQRVEHEHNRTGDAHQGRHAKPALPQVLPAKITIVLNGNELIGQIHDLAQILHELKYIELNAYQGEPAAAMAEAPPTRVDTYPDPAATGRNRRGCRGGNYRGQGSKDMPSIPQGSGSHKTHERAQKTPERATQKTPERAPQSHGSQKTPERAPQSYGSQKTLERAVSNPNAWARPGVDEGHSAKAVDTPRNPSGPLTVEDGEETQKTPERAIVSNAARAESPQAEGDSTAQPNAGHLTIGAHADARRDAHRHASMRVAHTVHAHVDARGRSAHTSTQMHGDTWRPIDALVHHSGGTHGSDTHGGDTDGSMDMMEVEPLHEHVHEQVQQHGTQHEPRHEHEQLRQHEPHHKHLHEPLQEQLQQHDPQHDLLHEHVHEPQSEQHGHLHEPLHEQLQQHRPQHELLHGHAHKPQRVLQSGPQTSKLQSGPQSEPQSKPQREPQRELQSEPQCELQSGSQGIDARADVGSNGTSSTGVSLEQAEPGADGGADKHTPSAPLASAVLSGHQMGGGQAESTHMGDNEYNASGTGVSLEQAEPGADRGSHKHTPSAPLASAVLSGHQMGGGQAGSANTGDTGAHEGGTGALLSGRDHEGAAHTAGLVLGPRAVRFVQSSTGGTLFKEGAQTAHEEAKSQAPHKEALLTTLADKEAPPSTALNDTTAPQHGQNHEPQSPTLGSQPGQLLTDSHTQPSQLLTDTQSQSQMLEPQSSSQMPESHTEPSQLLTDSQSQSQMLEPQSPSQMLDLQPPHRGSAHRDSTHEAALTEAALTEAALTEAALTEAALAEAALTEAALSAACGSGGSTHGAALTEAALTEAALPESARSTTGCSALSAAHGSSWGNETQRQSQPDEARVDQIMRSIMGIEAMPDALGECNNAPSSETSGMRGQPNSALPAGAPSPPLAVTKNQRKNRNRRATKVTTSNHTWPGNDQNAHEASPDGSIWQAESGAEGAEGGASGAPLASAVRKDTRWAEASTPSACDSDMYRRLTWSWSDGISDCCGALTCSKLGMLDYGSGSESENDDTWLDYDSGYSTA